ncbi:ArsR/SmtB family transcription factor [Pseudaestuariivita atlantica]|uniref:ArsR family transcriptional regulator n=1 Tax=Pseudaestuariivita atlantica TaxID=1317121 RepID=A0A0L1JRB8_9RHOB|nr:winged helix-turn-helix domain-containing protein [Pseudaestuariivita atlantica]KNG94344.1 ArsR family transcriptional regulator [Pseudaestuariivita atlantica]
MKDGPDIARIATLIGDPARANILTALMTGKALTARELAREAGVGASTTSTHLGRLVEGRLVAVTRQGRHRYHRLAGPEVANVLEALMGLAAGQGHLRHRPGPREDALRAARVCYNHLAGTAGTALYDALAGRGWTRVSDHEVMLSDAGAVAMEAFEIDVTALRKARSPLCRPCLDWSERRTHLAGSLGRALLAEMETRGWARRVPDSRAVTITPAGRDGLRGTFGVRL